VTHEQNGLLFSARDVASASQLTRSVLANDGLSSRLRAAARDFACHHGWKESAEHVRKSYRDAIARHHSLIAGPTPVSLWARLSTKMLVNFFRLASRTSVRGGDRSKNPLPINSPVSIAADHDSEIEVAVPPSSMRSGIEVSPGV